MRHEVRAPVRRGTDISPRRSRSWLDARGARQAGASYPRPRRTLRAQSTCDRQRRVDEAGVLLSPQGPQVEVRLERGLLYLFARASELVLVASTHAHIAREPDFLVTRGKLVLPSQRRLLLPTASRRRAKSAALAKVFVRLVAGDRGLDRAPRAVGRHGLERDRHRANGLHAEQQRGEEEGADRQPRPLRDPVSAMERAIG